MITVGETVPRALADAVVLDRASREKKLGAFWTDAPAIVVFLRHFGCVGCAQQVTELSPRMGELETAGARTVLVGNGAPEMIDAFVERHALGDKKCAIVTDPSLGAFRAADLVRSAWATIGVRAIVDHARAFAQGHRQPGVEGDRWQQGGALVCDKGGRVVLYHRNASIGDHVPAADLVDAALALLVRKSKTHV